MKLGEKVKCKGYAKKVKMKYCMPQYENPECYSDQELEIISAIGNELIFIEGTDTIFQKQFEIVEKEFEGIIVGDKEIALIKAFSCEYDDYKGEEYIYSFVKKEDLVKCAKVYYGFNKSRLVPLDLIENN